MINYEQFFSKNANRMKRSEIRELLKVTQKPGMISFAGGLPAPDLFPTEEIREICEVVLNREGKSALQYGPTEGDTRLRRELQKFMQEDGIEVDLDSILVVTSSQQGLDLVGKIFCSENDTILCSRPTYVGALQAFNSYGAKMIGVDQDEGGTQIDLLEAEIKKLKQKGIKPKFIYEIPDFQNPSGITMGIERRKKLIQLAEEYDLLIIEDSPYRQLRFEGRSEPALLSLNRERVIALYTFSKILLPGFRLGWMAGPTELIQKAVTAKQAVDLCSPPFNQAILYEFMNRGLLQKQIEKIIVAYRNKRDFMLEMFDRYLSPIRGVKWTKPQGGLFLWVTLPESFDSTEMFLAAVEKKVAYVVGNAFYPDGGGRNSFRINFSYSNFEEIEEGTKRLADVIRNFKKKNNSIITP